MSSGWSMCNYTKKEKYNRDTCMPMFIAAVFTITKLWNQPWGPNSR
jgi:hypothetical protein